jgi:hypothetical protein
MATVTSLSRDISDHTSLLLDTGDKVAKDQQPPFKFELGWLLKEGFFELVSEVWKRKLRNSHQYKSGNVKLGD